MTPAEHYAKAEEHLAAAAAIETDGHDDSMSAWHQRQALVHARSPWPRVRPAWSRKSRIVFPSWRPGGSRFQPPPTALRWKP